MAEKGTHKKKKAGKRVAKKKAAADSKRKRAAGEAGAPDAAGATRACALAHARTLRGAAQL